MPIPQYMLCVFLVFAPVALWAEEEIEETLKAQLLQTYQETVNLLGIDIGKETVSIREASTMYSWEQHYGLYTKDRRIRIEMDQDAKARYIVVEPSAYFPQYGDLDMAAEDIEMDTVVRRGIDVYVALAGGMPKDMRLAHCWYNRNGRCWEVGFVRYPHDIQLESGGCNMQLFGDQLLIRRLGINYVDKIIAKPFILLKPTQAQEIAVKYADILRKFWKLDADYAMGEERHPECAFVWPNYNYYKELGKKPPLEEGEKPPAPRVAWKVEVRFVRKDDKQPRVWRSPVLWIDAEKGELLGGY